MSKQFAEKILASMVDEQGNCSGRGLSAKQFWIIAEHLERSEDPVDIGYWKGQHKSIYFEAYNWYGNIGSFRVVLQERYNWSTGYAVESISLRPEEELEEERRAEAEEEAKRNRLSKLRDFSGSEWVGRPKQRLNLTLTLVNVYEYDGVAYSYYGSHTHYIYTFRDESGNCFVWKTQKSVIDWYDEDRDEWVSAEVGSKIRMKATVKDHNTYNDVKQTIINRPKVLAIS